VVGEGGFGVRAAVDVMGGDKAPGEILKGCWAAASLLDGDDAILLVGDEAVIRPALAASGLSADQLRRYVVVHASQSVGMDESPVEAIKGKPDSSLAVVAKLVSKGEADVAISAGNTGAFAAAAQLRMRLLPGVARPGIAVGLPTAGGTLVLCDAGANVGAKPHHLLQYALMAGVYATAAYGIENPRVGLLSVGEEDAKGNPLVKAVHKMLRDEPQVNFVGNIEGRDLTRGVADVVVCDGFVGNVVLKMLEGTTSSLFKQIIGAVQKSAPEILGPFRHALQPVIDSYDWQEHGGAPLLGVGGVALICHGASEAKAIQSTIRVGKRMVATGVSAKIVARLEQSIKVEESSES
jgi:glycerol-3-phosphate acyltransferase PlsX